MANPYTFTDRARQEGFKSRSNRNNPYSVGTAMWEAYAEGAHHGELQSLARPQAPVNYFASAVMDN